MIYKEKIINITASENGTTSYVLHRYNDGAAIISRQTANNMDELRKYLNEHTPKGFKVISQANEKYRALTTKEKEELSDILDID